MLCQLSYRGLTTTRLRTLAARSAYVVFRSHQLYCLINSVPYAGGLPTQSACQRSVPGYGPAAAEITTRRDDHSPLTSQRDEPLDGNGCLNRSRNNSGKRPGSVNSNEPRAGTAPGSA